jgi:ATP-dependent Lhr-like helicase
MTSSGAPHDEADPLGLHPLLTHHILNSLGWPVLRPLQKAAVPKILSGGHTLITAPTAGGKTEAAVFPVLSRVLREDWRGLSVLYLCPLRALLNNLHTRIERYARLVGRTVGLWHGDVGDRFRDIIRNDPPDVLLTTPESIEAMLISRKTDHASLFRNLRAVIVDEIHAFAGDDRGWHLLAVTERVQRIAGRELQRIGLSATVGNAEAVLGWLTRTSKGPGVVIAPENQTKIPPPEITVDYVGNLDNAATVISRLHRGEKRLVFVDSRARVEQLVAALRDRKVETFVSHGSLGREERCAAENAFANSRDCVIVSTSTLELGIDVGDLDRVIQIDAPPTVAAFLQRLGRTGRRPGTTANTLFLSTREDAFLQTLGLLECWEGGFIEPLEPPPLPLHLVVQQILALVLQEGGVGRHTWLEWYGEPFLFGPEVAPQVEQLIQSLIEEEFLFDDNGILGMGEHGTGVFGYRHFMELMAVFSEPPMLKVLAGRTEIGQVPMRLLTLDHPNGHLLLLAGRDWHVLDVDWRRGVVHVEPGTERGKIRWFGDGRALSFAVCQGIKRILAGHELERTTVSERAGMRLAQVRHAFYWVNDREDTVLVRESDGHPRWWTFAGMQVNAWLSAALGDLSEQATPTDLEIRLSPSVTADDVVNRLENLQPDQLELGQMIARGAIDRLKFAEAVPEHFAQLVVERRMRVDADVRRVASWPVRTVVKSAGPGARWGRKQRKNAVVSSHQKPAISLKRSSSRTITSVSRRR